MIVEPGVRVWPAIIIPVDEGKTEKARFVVPIVSTADWLVWAGSLGSVDVVPSTTMADPDVGSAMVWPEAVIVDPNATVCPAIITPADDGRME